MRKRSVAAQFCDEIASARPSPDFPRLARLEHFQAKWTPVRVKKMRQYKDLEPRSDSIGTEKALERDAEKWQPAFRSYPL
jgi:hypothetical protein